MLRNMQLTMLKNNKFKDALNKRVEGLRKEFTISVNEDFFKQSAMPQLPAGMKIKTKEQVDAEQKSKKITSKGSVA